LTQNGVTKQTTTQEIANLASGGGGAITIQNDTTSSVSLYPLFADATSGTATTLYTSDPDYNFVPSTGELIAKEMMAANGIFVNAATITQDYTIPSGFNAMSAGPITIAGGVTVTDVDGNWTIVDQLTNLPYPFGVAGLMLVSTGASTAPVWGPVDGGSF
jgi:hypothetical protein